MPYLIVRDLLADPNGNAMTDTGLRIIDDILMAAGGLVAIAAVVWWWLKSRTIRREQARRAATPIAVDRADPQAAARQSGLPPLPGNDALDMPDYAPAPPLRIHPSRPRRIPWRDPLIGSPLRPNRLGLAGVWLCVAVTLLGWSLCGRIGEWLAPAGLDPAGLQNWRGIVAANTTAVLNIVVCLLVARACFAGGLRGFGIGRRSLSYDLVVGLAGWLVALCLTEVIVIVSQWLIRRLLPGYQPPEHGVFKALRDSTISPWMQAFTIVGTAILVPISEEFLFRGILQTGAQKAFPARWGSLLHRWGAIIFVGALFGTMHASTPQFIPALIALGMFLGFLYERTGSLMVPILVHMLFNGKSLLWDYMARACLQNQP